jgi:hypothetical protein
LDVKTVEVEGTQITIEKVFEPATFAEILGIEELRARRAAVVRTIDHALSQITQSHPNYAFRKSYESRKFVLLTREERLENEFNRNKIALVRNTTRGVKETMFTFLYRNTKYQNDKRIALDSTIPFLQISLKLSGEERRRG